MTDQQPQEQTFEEHFSQVVNIIQSKFNKYPQQRPFQSQDVYHNPHYSSDPMADFIREFSADLALKHPHFQGAKYTVAIEELLNKSRSLLDEIPRQKPPSRQLATLEKEMLKQFPKSGKRALILLYLSEACEYHQAKATPKATPEADE